jgi:threonyl-tRNA synthetase
MDSSPQLHVMRHSCAHIMAAAIREIWPTAKFGVGPVIDNGFYYDVLFPEPINLDDLEQIARVMRKLQGQKERFVRRNVSIEEALAVMQERSQDFKVELLHLLRERGSTAVSEETGDADIAEEADRPDHVTLYQVGDFVDLCRGPHVEFSSQIGHFKLHALAGAYWRGSERNPQLQRIYGLCYATEDEVRAEIERLEQVKQRDHRRIGKDLDIFHLSREVGSGLPLWLPNGAAMRDELEFLARDEERKAGYQRVVTPHIANEKLYYQSGHLPYYNEDMYAPMEIEGDKYYLRPMNCPHHHHIFLSRPKSYRDMPVRLAEYGQVYRYEGSGALSGLMRTRGFCQNDAHIYCRYDQAMQEFIDVMNMHARYYRMFEISDFYMRLALPDLGKLEKYADAPEQWRVAIDIIRAAMRNTGLQYREAKGEAAFYGPKVDFIIKSAIGTENAISTNQLDFLASKRFGLTYIGEDGKEHPVYVIHRAPLGSHERFVAFLIEHYGGNFPIWLAPVQVVIVPISDRHLGYANKIQATLRAERLFTASVGVRVEVDATSERMQKKVRSATLRKIPVILVVGEKEEKLGTVSVRLRSGRDLGQVEVPRVIEALKLAVEGRDDAVFGARLGN